MGDLWSDLQIAIILIVFVYAAQWGIGVTGSKRLGIVLTVIMVYLTVYQHIELLILVFIFFFGYSFFDKFESAFLGG